MARLLDIVKPVLRFLPEVQKPLHDVPFREKVLWTVVVLFIFLVSCQIPLYGVYTSSNADPFYWVRVIIASNRGTIMELGITPIITASTLMQLLGGAKIISYDQSSGEDRRLFDGTEKLLALIMTLGEAVAYVATGMYGDLAQIGLGNAVMLVTQLMFSGIIVLLLDDLLQKGWGIGSGISLFIATNICESVIWRAFSPTTLNTGRGTEFEGAIIAFFHMLLTKSDKSRALREAFNRPNLPNLTNICATVLVFFITIYLQGFHVSIPIVHRKQRGVQAEYPIKLFYTSNTPIIFVTAIITNVYFLSRFLFNYRPDNFFIRLLGVWKPIAPNHPESSPVSGLAYFLSTPKSFGEVLHDPLHAAIYTAFIMASCGLISYFFVSVSGQGPEAVTKSILDGDYMLAGSRDRSLAALLKRYVPVAAALGGIFIGALTVFADLLGAIGSGTGILLAVTTIYHYFEIFSKEKQEGLGFLDL